MLFRPGLLVSGLFLLASVLAGLPSPVRAAETELCDGRDNDADATVDEGCPSPCADPRPRDPEIVSSTAGWAADVGRDRGLVWDGRGFGGVWSEESGYDTRIAFRRWDPSGAFRGDPVYLSNLEPIDENPALAWSGGGYGIVWSSEDFGLPEIFFAFIDDQGIVSVGPTRVSTAGEDGTRPAIAWDGDAFVVAWAWYNSRIHMRRVSPDGAPLGVEACVSCGESSGTGDVSLAVAGDQIGYAYSDGHGGVRFLRSDLDGNPLGSAADLTLQTGAGQPSLVFTGTEWGVAWYDRRDSDDGIFFNRIDAAGQILDSDRRINGTERYGANPSLAFTGQIYLLAWGGGDGPDYSILFRGLDQAGVPLYPSRLIPAGDGPYARPSLTWTGGRPAFLRDEDDLSSPRPVSLRLIDCCADLDGDGQDWCEGDENDADPATHGGAPEICDGRDNDQDGTLDEGCDRSCEASPLGGMESLGSQPPLEVATATRSPASGFVIRADGGAEGVQLVAEAGGPPWSPSRLETDAAESLDPAAAWTGTLLSTVFDDRRGGQPALRLTNLDGDGSAVDEDLPLSAGSSSGSRPALAWGGRRLGLAWRQGANSHLAFTLLSPHGARLLDDAPLGPTASGGDLPSIAACPAWGGGTLVAWLAPSAEGMVLEAEIRDEEGGRKAGPVEIAPAAPGRGQLAAARSAEGYLFVWSAPAGNGNELFGVAADTGLTPGGAAAQLTAAGGGPRDPALAFTGAETLAVFRDARDAGRFRPFRLRLDAAAQPLGPAVPLGTDRDVGPPAAAWDGQGLRLAWSLPEASSLEQARTAWIDCAAAPEPGLVRGLRLPDPSTATWQAGEAAVYDVVSGDLDALLQASGDFSGAVDVCEADDYPSTELNLPERSLPRFYLVRAVTGGTQGSYDGDGLSQIGGRDESISQSPTSCP